MIAVAGFVTWVSLVAPIPGQTAVAVMPIVAPDLDPEVVSILDEVLLTEVDRLSDYQVLGAADVTALLGLELLQQSLGCEDAACGDELGGALGARLLLTVRIESAGDAVILKGSLRILQTGSARASDEIRGAADEAGLPARVRALAAELMKSDRTERDPQMLARFREAGLSRDLYDEFHLSDLDYTAWARDHNGRTESWVVEIGKWAASGLSVIALVGITSEDARRGSGAWLSTGLVWAAAAVLWGIDLTDPGNAPAALP